MKKIQIMTMLLCLSIATPTQATWNGFREFVQKNKTTIKYVAAAIIAGFAAYQCQQKATSARQQEDDLKDDLRILLDWNWQAFQDQARRNPANAPTSTPFFTSSDWVALSDICIIISLIAGSMGAVNAYPQLYETA